MLRNNFLIFILMLFCAGMMFSPTARADTAIGQLAPPLTGKTLQEAPYDLQSMKGKVVLVHFWATWCPPCREEMPILANLYKEKHAQGLEFIAISYDKASARIEVESFTKDFGFPVAMVSDLSANGFGSPEILPLTYIIGRDGRVAAKLSPAYAPTSLKVFNKTVEAELAKSSLP